MIIGILRFSIYLDESSSLKDKRRVVQGIKAKTQQKFNAAVAEVEDLEDMRIASLGVVCLSNSSVHAHQMLMSILAYLEETIDEGRLGEIETELLPYP